jgi:hypothetical protein
LLTLTAAVHEISGVVPGQVIDALLRSMGIEPGDGVSPDLLKGGFDAVRREVKRVGREGWSAGQVLEQVGPGPCRRSSVIPCSGSGNSGARALRCGTDGDVLVARRDHTASNGRDGPKVPYEHGYCRVRQGAERGRGRGATATGVLHQDTGRHGEVVTCRAWRVARDWGSAVTGARAMWRAVWR